MKTRILIHPASAVPVDAQPLEIVERKGTGHPDSICNASGEAVSIHLSQAYHKTFGPPTIPVSQIVWPKENVQYFEC